MTLYRAATIPDLLIRALDLYPERSAMRLGDSILTSLQLREKIACIAQGYAARGINRGTPVAMRIGLTPIVKSTNGWICELHAC
jgi:hypothetical protein